MIKKILLVASLTIVVMLTGCYKPNFSFEAVDPGQLQNPTVDRNTAAYREKYKELDKYKEPVKITVAATQLSLESGVATGTTPQNQTFNQIAKDVLNIDLEYVVLGSSSTYDQKLKLYMASGKMPDMFYTTDADLVSDLINDDKLADLSDSFWYLNDNLQDNYLKYFRELLPTAMRNDILYAFPGITNNYTQAQRLYLRQDWLDIVGMDAPKTIEEMIAVGDAFVKQADKIAQETGIQANRVIPFTMNKEVTWAGSFSGEGFFNSFNTSINAYFKNSKGELEFSNTSQNTKKALSALNEMYNKKILDQEFLSKTSEQIQANIRAGYVGMTFGEWWMCKDALDDTITNIDGSNWTWVDIPAGNETAKPIVSKVSRNGYNVVSKSCKHPEAAARLINLFYDIYYNDNAQEIYGDKVLPSEGFYYQFVPIKLWDGSMSMQEYYRVNEVFTNLKNLNCKPSEIIDSKIYNENGIIETVLNTLPTDYIVSSSPSGTQIINRKLIESIEANDKWSTEFNKLRNREKVLHFAEGYPYYIALESGKTLDEMTKAEKTGWGIYHEMIDPKGGYAYVVELTEKKQEVMFNEFYGSNLSAMSQYGEYINTQTNIIFTKMITGDISIDDFDKVYVKDIVNKNGGDTILSQVNEWYKSNNIDYDHIYKLVS